MPTITRVGGGVPDNQLCRCSRRRDKSTLLFIFFYNFFYVNVLRKPKGKFGAEPISERSRPRHLTQCKNKVKALKGNFKPNI